MVGSWTDVAVREALGLGADGGDPGLTFSEVSTDSRTVGDGALYVALVGERFDGHDFVEEALARGARGAIVQRVMPDRGRTRLYTVEDTLVALGALAAHRRSRLQAPVVAITGSSGKTTTKDFTAAALSATLRVHATAGNRNNRIGMPLTLLATPDDVEAVVLELGTNEPGEIAALARISRPDIAVVTTVGESHLEKLGSLEGVFEEKLDLLRHLSAEGSCVVGDEPEELAPRARAITPRVRVAGWSERADSDLRPEGAQRDASGRFEFIWQGQSVVPPLPGRHAVSDALLALAVADLLGVAPARAAAGLTAGSTAAMRGQSERVGELTLILDCYNANPQSVRAAMDVLGHRAPASRRIAVLGSMLELGDRSERLHEDVLGEVLTHGLDLVVATGAFADAAAAIGAADRSDVLTSPDWRTAYPALRDRLIGDEVVLLKASRGIALEGILELLRRDFAPADAVEA